MFVIIPSFPPQKEPTVLLKVSKKTLVAIYSPSPRGANQCFLPGAEASSSEGFEELLQRLRSCIDALEPRGLSMVAYSAAKLLYGEERRRLGVAGVSIFFLNAYLAFPNILSTLQLSKQKSNTFKHIKTRFVFSSFFFCLGWFFSFGSPGLTRPRQPGSSPSWVPPAAACADASGPRTWPKPHGPSPSPLSSKEGRVGRCLVRCLLI